MHRSIARLSASVPSRHTQFWAAFTTNIAESNFRYTQVAFWLQRMLTKAITLDTFQFCESTVSPRVHPDRWRRGWACASEAAIRVRWLHFTTPSARHGLGKVWAG